MSNLPAGYQQVAYIESAGNQYIDTEFTPSRYSSIELDIEILVIDQLTLFGARKAYKSAAFSMFLNYISTTGYQFRDDYGHSAVRSDSLETDQLASRFIINKDQTNTEISFWENGTKIMSVKQPADPFTSSGGSLYLLANNTNGCVDQNDRAEARIYSCKVYRNGSLVRDFVPCKTDDGKYGLYDLVNGKFHGNKGTGVFDGA